MATDDMPSRAPAADRDSAPRAPDRLSPPPLLPLSRRRLGSLDAADWRNAIEHLPADSLLILSTCRLSQVCALAGDLPAAQVLYESLLPYARRTMITGSLGGTSLCAVAHYLGLLAAVLSRWDEAVSHLEVALQLNAALGNAYHAGRTRYAYASVLLARNRDDDWDHARMLLKDAVATFEDLADPSSAPAPVCSEGGAPASHRTASAAAVVAPRPPAPGAQGQYVLQAHGQYWTIAYRSPAFHLRDMRGLHYVALLLRRPNHPFHVMDLVAEGNAADAGVRRQLAGHGLRVSRLEDCDLVFDARARHDYQARLAELREEQDEAARNNDLGRSARLESEISFIAEHLAAAARPGRTSRGGPSPVERARVNVRNCITAAINAMMPHNEALARHLRSAIRTGTFCCYAPDRDIRWEL
jgi:tetratricopeptide (TPR) repeat protein